jgi:hypothetical protein
MRRPEPVLLSRQMQLTILSKHAKPRWLANLLRRLSQSLNHLHA